MTIIALPFTSTVPAQMSRKSTPVQSNTTANNNKPLPNDITTEWYNEALTSIQQLEEQIKPVQPIGSYTATNMRSRTGFYISPSGYTVRSLEGTNWEVAFQLKGKNRNGLRQNFLGQKLIERTITPAGYSHNEKLMRTA